MTNSTERLTAAPSDAPEVNGLRERSRRTGEENSELGRRSKTDKYSAAGDKSKCDVAITGGRAAPQIEGCDPKN